MSELPNNPQKQYEKIVQPAIEYLCDPQCRVKDSICEQNLRQAKKVILYYPFAIENNNSGIKERHTFIFIKLESDKHNTKGHALGAIKHYVLHKKKTPVTLLEGKLIM